MNDILSTIDNTTDFLIPDYSDGKHGKLKLSYKQLNVGDTVAVKKSTVVALKDEMKDKATICHLPKEYKRLATVLFVGRRFVVVKYSPVGGGIGGCISNLVETFNGEECEELCLVRRAA